jgi:hypothetical protein
MLSDFEELKVYVVGSKPHPDEADVGLWKSWGFRDYSAVAHELWELLARPSVAAGTIDKLIEQLPRKAAGKGKARAQWLFKPDRTRALDTDFLNFLDEARRELASDLIRHNDRADLLQGTRLNEAVQRILDRLLFLRICEDRDIDTGRPLALILKAWRDTSGNAPPRRVRQSELLLHDQQGEYAGEAKPAPPRSSLWREVVAHFRALDRRPPSFIPFFNGNLFKPHFSEEIEVSDEWIAGFLDDVGDDESPYLFNVIPVEILGTIYERFLGKVVRPKGRGVTIEEKPEVRKAGGVYYTPRYIVDYIVEQTVGKLLEDKTPRESLKLHILDPACGSGSFLIRAFERVCEHWQTAMMKDEKMRRRQDCWIEPDTRDIHLTSDLKRRILTANIYGVDIDPGAVEVTQLSLYLKMLEGENRTTLARERDLFGSDVALLPPLEANIKCGNSLIASDFSLDPHELIRVKAFDWPIQFAEIMKGGGFDAVIGNPPYGAELSLGERKYLQVRFASALTDTAALFLLLMQRVLKSAQRGSFIIPKPFLYSSNWRETRNALLDELLLVCDCGKVWHEVKLEQTVLVLCKSLKSASYTSAVRREENICHLDEIPKEFCAEFGFVLSNVLPSEIALAQKIKTSGKTLADVVTNQRGAMLQQQLVSSGGDYSALGGKQIGRYFMSNLSKGKVIKQAVADQKAFVKPNAVLVQNIVAHIENPTDHIQIIATTLLDGFSNYVILDTVNQLSVKKPWSSLFVTGILNSKMINWYTYRFIFARAIRTMHFDAPVTDRIPICELDLTKSPDKSRHDALVKLVERMLGLMPKLRAAKTEQERATLQNAVTATDQQIDALVYDLYGLTPEEIKLVEKN